MGETHADLQIFAEQLDFININCKVSSIYLDVPGRELGSMVSKCGITQLFMGYIGVITHLLL